MPSLKSGYTLADFLLRLERSPVTHMAPLYHEHRELFLHRPDVFEKTVMSVGWEKGLALVNAAYYSQRIEVGTYRAVLARMLLHNKFVERQIQQQRLDPQPVDPLKESSLAEARRGAVAEQRVDWRVAMKVYMEALTAHGRAVPSRMAVSTLRLLAPHGRTASALRILRIAEVNGTLTKPMLIDAAACCANGGAWAEALHLLTALHREDSALLTDSIQSLRPLGHDMLSPTALASGEAGAAPALAGTSVSPEPPTPQQKHILGVLATVVAAVPGRVALTNDLCFSFLTHLTASTTLTPEEKAAWLGRAIAPLSWEETVLLVRAYAEPNLINDDEWKHLVAALPHPKGVDLLGDGRPQRGKGKKGGKGKKKKKASRKVKDAAKEERVREQACNAGEGAPLVQAEVVSDAVASENRDSVASVVVAAGSPAPELLPEDPAALVDAIRQPLQLLAGSPAASAALVAALTSKSPTAAGAWALAVQAARGAEHGGGGGPSFTAGSRRDVPLLHHGTGDNVAQASPFAPFDVTPAAFEEAVVAARLLHPLVRRSLLQKCAAIASRGATSEPTWPVAAAVLLSLGSAHGPTPAGVLGPVLRELRLARQVPLVMRVLLEHVVPTHSTLPRAHWRGVFECILAHNRAVHQRRHDEAAAVIASSGDPGSAAHRAAELPNVVHWRSALSWAADLQASAREERIVKTGTGASAGAEGRRPAETVSVDAPFSPRLLSLLVHICVDGGSPQGALEALGRARAVDKTELFLSAEIRALLYCVMYDRPFEAESIVQQAERRHGEKAAAPLRRLLSLAQSSKLREEAVTTAAELLEEI